MATCLRKPPATSSRDILGAVGVPLIVTGCSHYEKNNALMKHIASTFAGENLLLNWVETDNYKTIAATVMAYNHCVVAQTPIDVNMCKQLNILLTTMGVQADRILVDPLTGALGYGLEYTYSVMERIRSSAFTGDPMLAMPMIVNTGFEVSKVKESRAPRKDFPLVGKRRRARSSAGDRYLGVLPECRGGPGGGVSPPGRSHPQAQDRRNDVLWQVR